MPSPATLLTVTVHAKTPEARDICRYELLPVDGAVLPAFTAGAHVEVHLPSGRVRAYSLCNAPTERHRYVIAVHGQAAGRGGSREMHDAVHPGMRLRIGAPANHFALVEDAPHSLLVAGGIGITPLLSMAERLHALQAPFTLHFGARSPAHAAFAAALRSAPYARQVHLHFDSEAGRGPDVDAMLAQAPAGAHLYVCGPTGLMDAVLAAARAQGWAEDRLHHERFAGVSATPGDAAAFVVELARSSRIVPVPPHRSVTQALADAGIDVPVSCEAGVCGTCVTRVLAGVPEHRDTWLSPSERAANNQFTPCCSRAHSPRLLLDL